MEANEARPAAEETHVRAESCHFLGECNVIGGAFIVTSLMF